MDNSLEKRLRDMGFARASHRHPLKIAKTLRRAAGGAFGKEDQTTQDKMTGWV